jgi:transcriptional regulator with XRE-family HTH domain
MDLLRLLPHFKILDARRRRIGMSYAALAKKSGVSMTTVVRILSGKHPAASFENVLAIAEALGMETRFLEGAPAGEFCEHRALEKAEQLIRMLQGTSGLEGQALDADTLGQMKRQTVCELLAGSKRRLWSD